MFVYVLFINCFDYIMWKIVVCCILNKPKRFNCLFHCSLYYTTTLHYLRLILVIKAIQSHFLTGIVIKLPPTNPKGQQWPSNWFGCFVWPPHSEAPLKQEQSSQLSWHMRSCHGSVVEEDPTEPTTSLHSSAMTGKSLINTQAVINVTGPVWPDAGDLCCRSNPGARV